jgi:RNA polymerase II-associated factor 1
MEIPTEGLAAYTSPAFASRMARAQPINIEADAFLGMPLDLVGMPGIFDGDESCKFICDHPLSWEILRL